MRLGQHRFLLTLQWRKRLASQRRSESRKSAPCIFSFLRFCRSHWCILCSNSRVDYSYFRFHWRLFRIFLHNSISPSGNRRVHCRPKLRTPRGFGKLLRTGTDHRFGTNNRIYSYRDIDSCSALDKRNTRL